MALRGNLEDLGPIELMQLPASGRKTGELVLVDVEREARLYYQQGNVTHARMEKLRGMDVLVELIDWREGDFEFRLGVTATERSIEMDLHRAIMQALKLRDERSLEATHSAQPPADDAGQRLAAQLKAFINDNPALRYVGLNDASMNKVAEMAVDGKVPDHIETIRMELYRLLESHPRKDLNRMIMVDEEGILLWARSSLGFDALLLAFPDSTLGAVSLAADKLVSLLTELVP